MSEAGLTCFEASFLKIEDEAFEERLPYLIREVEERGGYGFHGANEQGDVRLSAAYIRAAKEGLIERTEYKGFKRFARFMGCLPALQLTEKGLDLYEKYKAQEEIGELEPNKYSWLHRSLSC